MKKRGIKKRVLAALMTACMVVGAVPGVSFADVGDGSAPGNSMNPNEISYGIAGNVVNDSKDAAITLSKTAKLTEDGKYEITLTVDAENAKNLIEVKPTEVAFVLDASGSMAWCTDETHNHENATGGYNCGKVSKTNLSRWDTAINAVSSMSEKLKTAGVNCSYVYFTREQLDLLGFLYSDKAEKVSPVDALRTIKPKGGTCLSKGVKKGIEVLNGKDASANKILIILADGASDDGYMEKRNEQNTLNTFKKNGKSYTVSFALNKTDDSEMDETAFNALANAGNLNAKNGEELNQVFASITKDIISGIQDPLGSNITMTNGTLSANNGTASYDETTNTIKWNSDGAMKDKVTLTYTVELTDDAKKKAGKIYLNGDAVFNYSYTQNGEKKEKSISFPKPFVTAATLKVNYVNGNTIVQEDDLEWVALVNGNEAFTHAAVNAGTEITGKDGKIYYVMEDAEIPAITNGEAYTVNVAVAEKAPEQKYEVSYDANGGEWSAEYQNADGYQLNEARNILSNNDLTGKDKVKNLAEKDAPSKDGFKFKGWSTSDDENAVVELFSDVNVSAVAKNGAITLYAVWEEDGSAPAETVTYVVNKHYFDTDKENAVYDESVDVNQTADEGSLISEKISGLMTTQNYYNADYLYSHATVTVGGTTTAYTDDSKFQSGKNTIDLYYYRDSWNKNDGSETGGDGTPDIEQVLVKFGNKDGNGTVTDKENAAANTGTVQVYTLEDATSITPTLEGVEVNAADGYEFAKWTKNSADHSGVKPDITWSVKGGDEINFWAWFDAEEPEEPTVPTDDELKELISVALVHTGSNADHKDAAYDLIDGSYTVASASDARAIVTVNADAYVKAYNDEYGTHELQGRSSAKLTFKYGGSAWELADGKVPVTFTVKCTDKKPEPPKLPKDDELKKLFGESINVTCTTDADHAAQKFGLISGSYGVARDKDDENTAVVTVRAAKYIEAYLDGKHTNAGNDAARVTLWYDTDDAAWYAADQEISISFLAKCEKKAPEKQYTEIKFIVVNGTFTENGGTEITKTFEVGTKLTVADIPASKGKSSSYSDQTWDKFPVGYVVGENGETFTITYKWRSTGGNSSSDSDSDGTSTRGRATNAAGKTGRWILEGGEFTEDNGRLPSNEYLKIGDTIYGFYTYGFAIDFDRPEYYTDEAIQAKGGYRDATGTWRLNGWWFCYDDGTFPHNEWVYLSWNGRSDWYYFDVDGWMEDGWFFWNNNWYYLHTQYDNTRGHMYTGWHEIDGKWYYFNTASDKGTLGAMLADTTTPDGYRVDANGAWIQ